MSTTNKSAKAQKNANASANLQVSNKQTATEKAAARAEKEKARESAKALKELQKRAERDEKFVLAQAAKVARDKAKADAKTALSYNTYGVIIRERNTPFAACKHFYLDMQNACGGALLQVLAAAIGNDKRDFAERYADGVREYVRAKGYKNYTAFAVWRVLWNDLQKFTRADMNANPQILAACKQLQTAVAQLAEIRKAEKAEKAAAKANKAA